MIDRLILRAGPREQHTRFEVPAAPMTLFIGPNNSGKTLLLKEVSEELSQRVRNRGVEILLEVSYRAPSEAESRLLLEGKGARRFPIRGPAVGEGRFPLYHLTRPTEGRYPLMHTASVEELVEASSYQLKELATMLTLVLDLGARLRILSKAKGLTSVLGTLMMDPVQRRHLSTLVHEATGWHFSIDANPLQPARAMLSRVEIPSYLEQSYSDEARAFHERGKPLADFSEGIRSFVGILGAYLCADFRVFIVDEPEAFLHPPLARRLGRVMTELSSSMNATTLAATHSPEFLLGCVQSGIRTTVVRLTYEHDLATFRLLQPDDLTRFMQEPRLRSSGVLNALFHKCAIVTEADSDRAFYEEANLRLLSGSGGHDGAAECCFLNANGKDSLDRIVYLLRRMGLPAAAIVDLDLLGAGGLMKLLTAANMPESTKRKVAAAKPDVIASFHGKKVKSVGIAGSSNLESVRGLLDILSEYGVFLVPVGELEHWLSHLEVSGGDKSTWLGRIFDRMGSNPTDPRYVDSGEGDVWEFLGRIGKWLRDAARKGMPTETPAPQTESRAEP